jgi:hypothetical protein
MLLVTNICMLLVSVTEALNNFKVSLLTKSKSKLLYDWRSVSQYVLVSSALVGLANRYYFLSEFCCLKFAVLYLLAALSDERTDLQFAV